MTRKELEDFLFEIFFNIKKECVKDLNYTVHITQNGDYFVVKIGNTAYTGKGGLLMFVGFIDDLSSIEIYVNGQLVEDNESYIKSLKDERHTT